jgi:hypothetical protein
MPRIYTAVLIASAVSAMMWAGLAAGTYRVTHHGHPGLRSAAYAHARDAAHAAHRWEQQLRENLTVFG